MWDSYLTGLNKTDIPQKFIKQWDGDVESLQLINIGINAVFKFSKKGKNYYLRITHEKLRPLKNLAAAIDFQSHLFNEKTPVCEPIASKNNVYIETMDVYLGHVCLEVPGNPISLRLENLDIYYNWGQALGKLHKASQTYVPSEKFHFNNWQDSMDEIADYAAEDKDLLPHYDRLYEWVSNLPQIENQYGLIHADHRDANVICKGTEVGIIDFDEPDYHWYMLDIMRPFLEVYSTPKQTWEHKFKKYITGYQSIHPIDIELLKQGDLFIQLKALNMYLWTKNNWSGDEIPGGGDKTEWLEMLRKIVITPSILDFNNLFI